jgi:hypothetical protein
MVYTVFYFINGTTNIWKSGISNKYEAEVLVGGLSSRFPHWDMSIGCGVDPASSNN